MSHFLRPSADVTDGGWTRTPGGTQVDLWAVVDELAADDADYIQSASAPANDPCVLKLSSADDPLSSSQHVVRYRYRKDLSGGSQIDLTVQLRQGYVSESNLGLLIAQQVHSNIPAAITDGEFTLTAAEADAISNYTNLFLRFVANQV